MHDPVDSRRAAKHLLAAASLLALCWACGAQPADEAPPAAPSPAVAAPDGGDITAAQLASVRALACPGNAFACEALGRFEAASGPPPTTTVAYSLIGRAFSTFNAWRGEEVDWFVARGEQMSFGDVIAENEAEQAQTREVLATLAAGGTVDPAHPLAGFVRSLATGGQAAHPTELRGRSRYYRQDEMGADVFIRQGVGEILVVKTNATGAVIGVFRQG